MLQSSSLRRAPPGMCNGRNRANTTVSVKTPILQYWHRRPSPCTIKLPEMYVTCPKVRVCACAAHGQYILRIALLIAPSHSTCTRPEPIMLQKLPIILLRISFKFCPLYIILRVFSISIVHPIILKFIIRTC